MSSPSDWRRGLLDFWFGLPPEQHWHRDEAVDAEIARRFAAAWHEEQAHAAQHFLNGSAEDVLAAILLFDQVPRNMFRNDPRAYATDPLARAVAAAAVARGTDQAIAHGRRHFVYMPLEHSEDLADQERSVALYEQLGDETYLDFARKHRDVIARFGRFPHRNPVLGRAPLSPEEKAFEREQPW